MSAGDDIRATTLKIPVVIVTYEAFERILKIVQTQDDAIITIDNRGECMMAMVMVMAMMIVVFADI